MDTDQDKRTSWIRAIAKGEVIIPDAATSNDYDNEDDDNNEGNE